MDVILFYAKDKLEIYCYCQSGERVRERKEGRKEVCGLASSLFHWICIIKMSINGLQRESGMFGSVSSIIEHKHCIQVVIVKFYFMQPNPKRGHQHNPATEKVKRSCPARHVKQNICMRSILWHSFFIFLFPRHSPVLSRVPFASAQTTSFVSVSVLLIQGLWPMEKW